MITLEEMLVKIAGDKLTPPELGALRNKAKDIDDMLNIVPKVFGTLEKLTAGNDVLEQDVASVTINVNGIYKHVLMMVSGRTSNADYVDIMQIRVNGDTGANYQTGGFYNIGATMTAWESLSLSAITAVDFQGTLSNALSTAGGFVYFPNINSTLWKSVQTLSGAQNVNGTNQFSNYQTGYWKNAAPISTIQFFSSTGSNIKAGSIVSAYGIR